MDKDVAISQAIIAILQRIEQGCVEEVDLKAFDALTAYIARPDTTKELWAKLETIQKDLKNLNSSFELSQSRKKA